MLGYWNGGSSRKSCIILSMTCAGDSTRSSPSISNNCKGGERESGERGRAGREGGVGVGEGKQGEGRKGRDVKKGGDIYTVSEPYKLHVHIKYTLNEDKINIPIHVQYV